jgi:hypothetical protein
MPAPSPAGSTPVCSFRTIHSRAGAAQVLFWLGYEPGLRKRLEGKIQQRVVLHRKKVYSDMKKAA